MNGNLLHGGITEKILKCAFEVHSSLGCGFREIIYQRALALELGRLGIPFKREIPQEIFYKNFETPLGIQRVDFMVENLVLVELKTVPDFNTAHTAQLLNYLKVYEVEVGLLINFGSKSMMFKRIVRTF